MFASGHRLFWIGSRRVGIALDMTVSSIQRALALVYRRINPEHETTVPLVNISSCQLQDLTHRIEITLVQKHGRRGPEREAHKSYLPDCPTACPTGV